MVRMVFATAATVLLAALLAATHAEVEVTRGPGQTFELTDENFDEIVFPKSSPKTPFLIFFYAPWCGHCKMAKPYFYNASEYLMSHPEYSKRSAMFGLVDATAQKGISERYRIRSYPTVLYNVRSNVYRYEGGRGINDFVMFATYLFHGALHGSFADHVSNPVRFENVEKEAPGRAAFIMYIPRNAAPRSQLNGPDKDGMSSAWHQVVETFISAGKSRYAVIFEEQIPNQVAGNHEIFSQVVEVGKKAERHQRGPGGEALLLLSDAYDSPQLYTGPWEAETDGDSAKNEDSTTPPGQFGIHKSLRAWVEDNSFLAVEAITFETYPVLAKRPGLLAMLVLNAPIEDYASDAMLPALRQLVRSRNHQRLITVQAEEAAVSSDEPSAAGQMNFTFVTMDCVRFSAWCEQYGLLVDENPNFIAVKIKSELVYHSKVIVPQLPLKLREVPWQVGGEQVRLIEQFLAAVEQGAVTGDRTTTIGHIAEVVLRIPLMDWLHSWSNEDDTTFLVTIFLCCFVCFVSHLAMKSDAPRPKKQRVKLD